MQEKNEKVNRSLTTPGTQVRLSALAHKIMSAYNRALTPLSTEVALPPLAMDILTFIANNPGFDTARDVCQSRGIKPGIVSFHVDKLVNEGYLVREEVAGDRRKTKLVLTDKAKPVAEKCRDVQQELVAILLEGIGCKELRIMLDCFEIIEKNITDYDKNQQ